MWRTISKLLQSGLTALNQTNSIQTNTIVNNQRITPDQLKLMAPNCDYNRIAVYLNDAANEFDITTNKEIRHWIAHLCVESSHFTHLVENLYYSAKRLTQVWPKRFPTLSSAQPYANNPQALGNKVYGGRLGNSETEGFIYRGRGFIQLTGKASYEAAGKALGLDLVGNPDLAASSKVAARVAAWYWKSHGLNGIVNKHPRDDDIEDETRAINGGLIGLNERLMELHKAQFIWKD
jgi:putative chitinase